MVTDGKSVNLFLMDGDAHGRIKCLLANWTGVAYKIPRSDIELCRNREDLTRNGVYFLLGKSDLTGDRVVYIGQAGTRKTGTGILGRLREHNRDISKDYWSEAIVFTTSNNSFGPTEISYLENRFCYMAIRADRYDVKNAKAPSPGNITEEKESELEAFIESAYIVMGVLGHDVFKPYIRPILPDTTVEPMIDNPMMYLQSSGVRASGISVDDGFIVLKGSTVATVPAFGCPDVFHKMRAEHSDKIMDSILTEDILCLSSTAASGFVMFDITDGRSSWTTDNGMTLRDLENQ